MRLLQPKKRTAILWAIPGSLGIHIPVFLASFEACRQLLDGRGDRIDSALSIVSGETSIDMADQAQPLASSSYTSESSEEDEAQHSDEGQDRGGGDENVVNVDLEFFDPSEIDFHGLKMLLRSLLDGDDFPGCTDLVEAIIRQVLHTVQVEIFILDELGRAEPSEFAEKRGHCGEDCRNG